MSRNSNRSVKQSQRSSSTYHTPYNNQQATMAFATISPFSDRNIQSRGSNKVNITFTPPVSRAISRNTLCRSSSFTQGHSSGFPLRNSNYIANSKTLQQVKVASSEWFETQREFSAGKRKVKFPITDPTNHHQDFEMENWWQFLTTVDRPVMTVQTMFPFTDTEASSVNPTEKRFKSKVFNDGQRCKMFIDQNKIIYFKNIKPNVVANTECCAKKGDIATMQRVAERQLMLHERKEYDDKVNEMLKYYYDQTPHSPRRLGESESRSKLSHKKTGRMGRLFRAPRTFPNSGENFIHTHNKATLHDRSFYLKTPVDKRTGQMKLGATPCCKCRLCLFERELTLSEKNDVDNPGDDDNIINSIKAQLSKTVTEDEQWAVSCYPPNRPNSAVVLK
ncbi:hypothetical protein SNE40_007936 [Patella caerulea]